MKRSLILSLLTAISLSGLNTLNLMSLQPQLAQAQTATEPYLVRSSLVVRARTEERYWKGNDWAFDQWSWLPEIKFQLAGPLASGSTVVADFFRTNGKPWMSVELKRSRDTPPLAAGEATLLESERASQAQEKLASMESGLIPFRVRYQNELTGKSGVLFSGRMKVAKAHSGVPGPNFKNHFVYYNDLDWLAPVGYLTQDVVSDPQAPPVEVLSWLKGPDQDSSQIKGYLFYQGRQIGSTEQSGAVNSQLQWGPSVQIRAKENHHDWVLWNFHFTSVYGFYSRGADYPPPSGTHILANNPGDYEFKVTRKGQLVRSAKFSVQPDGYVKQTGFLEGNSVVQSGVDKVDSAKTNVWMFMPMQVQGKTDGVLDPKAWQTEAWWGNPQ